MKSDLAKKLKDVLDNMSREEFLQEWEDIRSLKLQGPSLHSMRDFLRVQSRSSSFEIVEAPSEVSTYLSNLNYSSAA